MEKPKRREKEEGKVKVDNAKGEAETPPALIPGNTTNFRETH